MNCTNKEQETAECEKRGCEGCAYNEKTADEIWKELGTNKTENEDFISYRGKVNSKVGYLFNKKEKTIILDGFNTINVYDLQAINKKVQELGWKG